MSIASNANAAHAKAMRLDVREITRRLNAALGATLVAGLSGSKDRRISHKWAEQDGPVPRQESIRRLQFAYSQWLAISEVEGEHVARMWFIGSNPWLEHSTPVEAIREGRFKETAAAAVALIDDSFSG